MASRTWVVVVANEPIPHEVLSHVDANGRIPDVSKGSAHTARGPFYAAGARWYSLDTPANRAHAERGAAYWRGLGYDVIATTEVRS